MALILGAGDLINPAAPNLTSLGPAFLSFASWYILGAIADVDGPVRSDEDMQLTG